MKGIEARLNKKRFMFSGQYKKPIKIRLHKKQIIFRRWDLKWVKLRQKHHLTKEFERGYDFGLYKWKRIKLKVVQFNYYIGLRDV